MAERLKPLPVAPLTYDDWKILEAIRERWHYPLNNWYRYYDRQDAALMCWAQVQRLGGDVLGLNAVRVADKWCGSMWWYADLVRVGGDIRGFV